MVKRFSKQVRDELHVACTNWLSPPAPGCGVSLMESARSVLCPASVTLECVRSACPARCGFDFKCYCKTKEKRQTPPCAMSLSVSFLTFVVHFLILAYLKKVSRLSSCRFFKSCKLCVSYHISKCSVFITDFVRGCLCPPCHCYTLGSSCGTCTEE